MKLNNNLNSIFINSIDTVDILIKQSKENILENKNCIFSEVHASNILKLYDKCHMLISRCKALLELYILVGCDNELKNYIQIKTEDCTLWYYENIIFDSQLFSILNSIRQELLSKIEIKYLHDTIRKLKKEGAHLNDELRKKLSEITKQIEYNCTKMQLNIQEDERGIWVKKSDLEGVSDTFVETLEKNEENKYYFPVNYPTTIQVLNNCSNSATRLLYHKERCNKGYPKNEEILKNLQELCTKKAHLTGYNNFAQYVLDEEMASTVETVDTFINDLDATTSQKALNEKQQLLQFIQSNFRDYNTKNIQPSDTGYFWNLYEKKNYSIDQEKISHYFPLSSTIDGLLKIYEKFFGITFKKYACGDEQWAWHKSLQKIEVYENNKKIGEIILDLHPRKNKYEHACKIGIIFGVKDLQLPLCAVICNFSEPSCENEALLYLSEVNTFFHEFGHALHHTFAATQFFAHSGTNTSRDFVEIPSQLFEQWLQQPEILKMISSHYKTKEPLPDSIINNIIDADTFGIGLQKQRQVALSKMALDVYRYPLKSALELKQHHFGNIVSLSHIAEYDHFECSFGHLAGYYAAYYSYMWSLIRAIDIFSYIKKNNGLLDCKIGKKLKNCILSHGSSRDYNEIIKDFLERDFSFDAFNNYINGL